MQVDLLLETFGTSWPEVREGARAAERAGFDGVWVNDHLAGSVAGAPYVLECWTVLTAIAADVPRIAVGPLVLNVANRDPGTLAVMAATAQAVSGGRLFLGLGAGASAGSRYATEQEALGRAVPGDRERRRRVEETIAILHRVWSGDVPPASGFLQPRPIPPIVVAATGPKMAELAGRLGDGICVPAGPTADDLVARARQARSGSGRDQEAFLVTALLSSWSERNQPPVGPDLDRLIVTVAPPFERAFAPLMGWLSDRGVGADPSTAPGSRL
jgi:alkanesulfonate monooxygenase SsuD/methylene tetrahydromethanopterin reductase-like flavin-dependent oxidoreductase (luciferase family)